MSDDIELDTVNRFIVGVRGNERVVILRWRVEVSKAEALNLAAWLVALAEEHDGDFARLLDAVQNT